MLVLTRRVGEVIVIDSTIRVTVVSVRGNSVRLGVAAPASVCVDRLEIHGQRLGLLSPALLIPSEADGESPMQTAQLGDRVRVHYVKRFQDGAVASSRGRAPVELTVGSDHPRLPGLGLALIGLTPGASTTVSVPPERAYGLSDPARVRRWARTRFPEDQPLPVGKWVRVLNRGGRHRLVRIVEVRAKLVVVDTNHRRAGQALNLEVELIDIQSPDACPDSCRP
jgi:carbon storage regulator CsrA